MLNRHFGRRRTLPPGIVLAGLWVAMSCCQAQSHSASKPTGDEEVVAVVQGKALTQADLLEKSQTDLDNLALQLREFEARQKQDRYDALRRNLDALIADRLLQLEADAQSVSVDDLIAAEVTAKLTQPTEADIDNVYEANKSRLNQSKDMLRPRIVDFIMSRKTGQRRQEFVESLKEKYEVSDHFEPLRFDIETEGHPSNGPAAAPVTLVEFSDFECPYCLQMTATLREVKEHYGDKIRVVFRQFPIPSLHAHAMRAAQASLCADEQGRFWPMHDRLFEAPVKLDDDALFAKASDLGLDSDKFKECLSSGRHADRVQSDIQAGVSVGVTGTPALFVNGRPIKGAASAEQIGEIIEAELGAKGDEGD